MAAVVLIGALLGAAGCGGGGDPEQAGATTTTNASGTPTASPPTGVPTDEPTLSGSPDLACLVGGSPWTVNLTDLESQFPALMRGINVTGVHITGSQTLTVDGSLHATFTDTTVTTMTVDMSSGLTMQMVQRHRGSASGTWRDVGNKLVADGPWAGGIHGTTRFTINGRAAQAPFQAPTGEIGDHPMTYTCADRTLMLTVEGSPFAYLLNPA